MNLEGTKVSGAPCAVCQSQTRSDVVRGGDSFIFDCPRCGPFKLTGSAQHKVLNALGPQERALVSHRLRRMQGEPSETVLLDTYTLDDILDNHRLPSAKEQSETLIRWLGDHQVPPNEYVSLPLPEIGAIMGTSDIGSAPATRDLSYMLNGLADQGIIETAAAKGGDGNKWRLTMHVGWPRYEQLKGNASAAVETVPASDRVVTSSTMRPSTSRAWSR
jgi:hypothetical protein